MYEKIKALIESDISAYQIGKHTGISRATISDYRTGKSDIKKMTLENALKLAEYWEEIDKMNFQNVILTDVVKQFDDKYEGLLVREDGTITGKLINADDMPEAYRISVIGKVNEDGQVEELHEHYGLDPNAIMYTGIERSDSLPDSETTVHTFGKLEDALKWEGNFKTLTYKFDDLVKL